MQTAVTPVHPRTEAVPRPTRSSPWAFELVFAAVTLAAVAVGLSIVGQHAGWPRGQTDSPQLIQIYADHFKQLDFFPIWSSSDVYGMGAPVLLYYGKLYYVDSGLIYLAQSAHMKTTLTLTTGLFLIVGVYGMRWALSTITKRRFLQVVGAVAIVFVNYTFTNWVQRGDLAEFSAMMLAPWVVWWCLNLMTTRRASFALVPIMALLIVAHVAGALIGVMILAIAVVIYGCVAGIRALKPVIARLIVAAGAVLVLLSPLFVALLKFNEHYAPISKLTRRGFRTAQNLLPGFFSHYLYDSTFNWSTSNLTLHGLTQLDFAIWIPVTIAIAVLIAGVVVKRRQVTDILSQYFQLPAMLFVLVSFGVLVFLQLSVSKTIYQTVGPLNDLQFPWRMLGFIAPLGIVAVIGLAEAGWRRFPPVLVGSVSALWLASLVALSPVFVSWPASAFEAPSSLLAHAHMRFGKLALMIGINGEYLPVIQKHTALQTLSYTEYLYYSHREAQAIAPTTCRVTQLTYFVFTGYAVRLGVACDQTGTRCAVVEPKNTRYETLQMRLTVSCDRPTDLALPIMINDYTTISTTGPNGGSLPVTRVTVPNDPRIVIRIPTARTEVLDIHLPTVWSVLF